MQTIHAFSFGNRAYRAVWFFAWLLLYRPSPRPFHGWRRMLLRLFGAQIASDARVYPDATIWAPYNLTMGPGSCLGEASICYNVAKVTFGAHTTLSLYSYLCTASHDYNDKTMPTIAAPITLKPYSWVAADVFVGPGVTVGEGAVVGARSSVFKDVPAWRVVAGSPAKPIGKRKKQAYKAP